MSRGPCGARETRGKAAPRQRAWLGGQDSNLDSHIQSVMAYH